MKEGLISSDTGWFVRRYFFFPRREQTKHFVKTIADIRRILTYTR